MSKPKVMTLITRMSIGGAAFHVLLLAKGLEALGYEVLMVTGACEAENGDLPIPVPSGRIPILLDGLSRSISPYRDLRVLWRMYRMMRREKPTIVHTHQAKAGMLGRIAACLAGVPVVVHTFHGNTLSGYFSLPVSTIFCWLERLLARATDRICVVSDQQLEELAGRFRLAPRNLFAVVPLGIEFPERLERPIAPPTREVLHVGWLGRLVKIKGVPLLAGVIDETARQGIPVRFLVAGDGPDRESLEVAVARYGADRVQWAGWERDPAAIISKCDVLIQTSRNEGTPVALIEGMAAGKPFVSTAAGGVVDLVNGTGLRTVAGCRWFANGVLADADPAAFSSALQQLWADPALVASMGAEAHRFAAERFRVERLLKDIDGLYAELSQARTASARSYMIQRLSRA